MQLAAYLDGDKLLVKVEADTYGEANAIRLEVSGSRKTGKHCRPELGIWGFYYPLSVDKCNEMREAWGTALKVHHSMSEWYRAAKLERAGQVARASQTDAELSIVAEQYPELNRWMFGDQRVTAEWIANAYRGGGLLADEVGTGKTAGVLAGIIEAGLTGPTLIVCPKISVKAVWAKHFAEHCPDVPVYLARGSRNTRERAISAFQQDPSQFKVLIIVAEMLRIKAIRVAGRIERFLGYEYPELYDELWSAVVVDESHKLLGAMDVVKANLAGEGLRALNYAPNRLKLAVSATPFGKGGRLEAMFGTLHWLWPDEYTSKWQWLERFFNVSEESVFIKGGRGAKKTVRKIDGLRYDVTEQQFWESLGPRVLRRRLEDVSPEHRGLQNWIQVSCEMDPRQAKQYKDFTDNAELAVQGGVISTVGVLDYLTRCRQFANGVLRKEGGRVVYTGESCKIDMLMAHLDQLDPMRKVIITSQYNEFLDAIEVRMQKEGYGWYRLDGKTTEAERQRMMNAFQGEDQERVAYTGRIPGTKNSIRRCPGCGVNRNMWHERQCDMVKATAHRFFLLNSQAGGVSITLDAAEEMHQLDRMYPPEANTQLYGRNFRRSRVHEVFYYMYETMGTIDEQITAKTEAGHEEQLRLLDGRRGLEYVRTLAKYEQK